jgi:hypothetical protein
VRKLRKCKSKFFPIFPISLISSSPYPLLYAVHHGYLAKNQQS